MDCRHHCSAWLFTVGLVVGGCGGAIVDVGTSDGTESTTDPTSEGPTTDPTIEPTSISDTLTTSTTSDTTTTDTDPTLTDVTDDTDPTTSSTSDTSSSTDAESSSSTDPSDSDSDSVGFIGDADAGGVAIECDVWQQDCPEGEKCMPWANDGGSSWNATRCTPIDANRAQIGDVCIVEGNAVSGIDSCDIGLMCWDVDPETNEGTCIGMCQGSPQNPTCFDPQASCAILSDGVLIVCLPDCDPLMQDCPGDDICVPIADSFLCAPDGSGAGGAQNDECEALNGCNLGLLCVDATFVPDCDGGFACCTSYCDLDEGGADAACAAAAGVGASCVPFWEEGQAPPGQEDVGVCVEPN